MTLDRRTFLRLTGLSVGSIVWGACSSSRPLVLPAPFAGITPPPGAEAGLQVFVGAYDVVAGRTQRVPVGLSRPDGETVGRATARAWLAVSDGSPTGPFPLTHYRYNRARPEDPQGYFVGTMIAPEGTFATMLVEVVEGDRTYVGTTNAELRPEPLAVDIGAKAIPAATPTTDDPRGVSAICTRDPVCPLHEVRLDTALKQRKPVVFTVGSPKLCTSRTCGPVLEEVLIVADAVGDKATFIHAEPYKGDEATIISPTMERWQLPSEPWVYVIDDGGIVRARFEGPVVAAELVPAVQKVLG